jgi:hypothetical protein
VPPFPVDAFSKHWNSHIYIPQSLRAVIIDYSNVANFSGLFAEQYLHQQIVTAEHPAISFLLEQLVHHQTALYYLYLDIMYSGKSAPSTYAIDAANQIGIDQNVLNTTLAKLRSSNFSKIAPAINTNIMPKLIPATVIQS